MSIYNVHGGQTNTAFDVSDNDLNRAWNVAGNLVFSKGETPDYSNYSYVQKWASKGIGSTQGYDIYDGKVFWVSKSGNSSVPANCYVWNLEDGSQALSSAYITVYTGHGNNLTFSDEYYDPEDNYPLLLASTAYAAPVYLNRISNNYVATLEKTYVMPSIQNVIAPGFDMCYGETSDIAYTATLFGSNSDASLGTHICIAKWDMTNLTDNGDGTYTPAFISSVNCDWHYWKQGIKYHDGLIWFASGYPGYRAYVYAFDPTTGDTKYTIDCETTTEIEGAVWYPDNEAVGGYALYVGFQGMMMRKYVFQAL